MGGCSSLLILQGQQAFEADHHDDPFQRLKKHLRQVHRFLQASTTGRFGKRPPCILILGPHRAGKHQLIQNQPHATPIRFKLDELDLDWWQTPEALFCLANPQLNPHASGSLWQTLLKKMKQLRKGSPFSQVHIVLPLPTSSTQTLRQQLQQINQSLQWLARYHHALPVTITLTHGDSLRGFVDFFENSDESTREKAWTLYAHHGHHTPWKPAFDAHLHHQINTLHQRALSLIHHEPCPKKRANIHSFPRQLERATPYIAALIEQLAFNDVTYFQQVDLLSTTQQGTSQDLFHPNQASTHLSLHDLPYHINTPYFCRQYFTMMANPALLSLRQQKKAIIIAMASLTLITIGGLYQYRIIQQWMHTPRITPQKSR